MAKRRRTSHSDSPPGTDEEDDIVFAFSHIDEDTNPTNANDGSLDDGQGAHPPPLFGLDPTLAHESSSILALTNQPIAEEVGIYHLRDVPVDISWSSTNTLTSVGGRAVIIVVFGNLTAIDLRINRGQATRLAVGIELFGQEERDKLKMIYKPGAPGKRLLIVYDRTGPSKHRMRMLGANELLGGDVVRLDMRCVRARAGADIPVEFKLKSIQLIAAKSRGVDIMH